MLREGPIHLCYCRIVIAAINVMSPFTTITMQSTDYF